MPVAYAASDTFVSTYFPSGKLSAPGKPYIQHFHDGFSIDIVHVWYCSLVSGNGDGTFDPATLLDREMMATLLTNVYKKMILPGWDRSTNGALSGEFRKLFTMPAPFADDAEIDDWAKDSVYYMVSLGLISGVGNNRFAPTEYAAGEEAVATCEMAVILVRNMVRERMGK